MNPSPKFSVIMPAYNAASTICESIESVLAQTVHDWELIVVDDGSTDETAECATRFGDRRIHVVRQKNAGIARARNAALAEATGSYVSFLDSDDLFLPAYLEKMGAVLDSDGEVTLVYTQGYMLDDRTGRIAKQTTSNRFQPGPVVPPRERTALIRRLLEGNFIFIAATLRRVAVDEVGRFADELHAVEDYDLWLRLAAAGHLMARVPEPLVVYRRRAGSASSDSRLMARHRAAVYRRAAANELIPAELRSIARERIVAVEEIEQHLRRGRLASEGILRLKEVLKRLLWRRTWYRTPPPEVRTAFPNLGQAGDGSGCRPRSSQQSLS